MVERYSFIIRHTRGGFYKSPPHEQTESGYAGPPISVSNAPNPFLYPRSANFVNDPLYQRDLLFQKSETSLLDVESRFLAARDNRRQWEKEERRRRNIEQLAWSLNQYPCLPFAPDPYLTNSMPLDYAVFPESLVKIATALGTLFGIQADAVIFMLLHLFVIAVHGRVSVKLDPMWTEAMESYGIVVRDSGGRKTEIMKKLKTPFQLFLEKIRLEHEKSSCDKRVLKEMKAVQNSFSADIRKELFPWPVYEAFKECEEFPLEKRFDALRKNLTEMLEDTDKSIPNQKEPPRIFFTNIT